MADNEKHFLVLIIIKKYKLNWKGVYNTLLSNLGPIICQDLVVGHGRLKTKEKKLLRLEVVTFAYERTLVPYKRFQI